MTNTETLYAAVKGDPRAVTAVVKQYTPLVHKIVNRYAFLAPAHSREDLVQEGLLGVVKALNTFEPERGYKFMTWLFPNVRQAVQSVARKEIKHPKYALSLEQSDWAGNLEDPTHFEVRDDIPAEKVQQLLVDGCGSIDSDRAKMICDRFGLMGHKPMRQGEVAKKYGITKQNLQSHMARFNKTIRAKHPELAGVV